MPSMPQTGQDFWTVLDGDPKKLQWTFRKTPELGFVDGGYPDASDIPRRYPRQLENIVNAI